MKRDWELIRIILASVEKMESTQDVLNPNDIDGFNKEIVSYHIYLLDQAGLIEATCVEAMRSPMHCMARNMTWYGHEFLDQIRSDTIWGKTKDMIKEKGLDLSFDTIKQAVGLAISSLLGG